VKGLVEQKLPFTRSGADLPDNHWNRGKKNIQDLPLVESSNILLPFLLITLGLMKIFGRAVY
jgi:hypothetical protein